MFFVDNFGDVHSKTEVLTINQFQKTNTKPVLIERKKVIK